MDELVRIEASDGTPFQKRVWRALCAIPRGTVLTYQELARAIGKPKAVRAVANAVGANPFAPDIPCHRVVRSDGGLGGYSGKGGTGTKLALLRKEGVSRFS
jgi:methylated-DNA-[protein]-cysteine S-methyltransferase